MGCSSSYMEPREHEKQSKLTAELIVYVNSKLGNKTKKWIRTAAKNYYGNESKINALVVKLCEICKNMSKNQQDSIIYNGRDKTARKLADWWDRHLEADRVRLEKEKADAENAKKKQAGLSKLSVEEKKALGIKD